VLLFVDQMKIVPKHTDIYAFPRCSAFISRLFQMLALLPGVSRSVATIVRLAPAQGRTAGGTRVHLLSGVLADHASGAFWLRIAFRTAKLIASGSVSYPGVRGFAGGVCGGAAGGAGGARFSWPATAFFAVCLLGVIFFGALALWGVLLFK